MGRRPALTPRRARAWARALLAGAAVLCAAGVGAQESIYGDFGVALGQVFDQRMAQGTVMLNGSTEAVRFTPSYPLYLFREYYAIVTPRSRLVAGILARSVEFATMAECVTHMNSVQGFLTRYGAPLLAAQSDREVMVQVDQGNRAAYLRCNRAEHIRMELNYVDYPTLQIRTQEGGR
jgi:hypothetical protein